MSTAHYHRDKQKIGDCDSILEVRIIHGCALYVRKYGMQNRTIPTFSERCGKPPEQLITTTTMSDSEEESLVAFISRFRSVLALLLAESVAYFSKRSAFRWHFFRQNESAFPKMTSRKICMCFESYLGRVKVESDGDINKRNTTDYVAFNFFINKPVVECANFLRF